MVVVYFFVGGSEVVGGRGSFTHVCVAVEMQVVRDTVKLGMFFGECRRGEDGSECFACKSPPGAEYNPIFVTRPKQGN